MALTLYLSFFLFLNYLTKFASADQYHCLPKFKCTPLTLCGPDLGDQIMYPCHSGLNMICCPIEKVRNHSNSLLLDTRKTSLFPVDCGIVNTDNRITGGQTADLGQFPWMALLGYMQRSVEFIEYLCGGTVISDRYILTAAHCIMVDKSRKLVTVRLGEHNLKTDVDCFTIRKEKICADPHVDVPVELYVVHQKFNLKSLKNDIALVKTKTNMKFTDYIQPICLPFERNMENRDISGEKLTVSGWGKTNPRNIGGSTSLQFANIRVWDLKKCNEVVPPEVKDLSDSQLCANGKIEDVCKGDSGGPLVNATLDFDGELRYFQVGIVSFALTMTCGIEELPPIYTRVDKYLSWVIENVV